MSNESFHIVAPLDQIAICVIDRLFYLRVQVRDLHRDAFRFIPIGKIRNVFLSHHMNSDPENTLHQAQVRNDSATCSWSCVVWDDDCQHGR